MPIGKVDYREQYLKYHSGTRQKKDRAHRNKVRRMMIRKHGKKTLDGKHIDHKDGNPRNNRPSNLRIVSAQTNRIKQ